MDRGFAEITFADVLEQAGAVDPVALAGVQDKASARMLSVPLAQQGRRFILKVEAAADALADLCAARVVAARALFQQLCFAWLTGNGDVHAKNLSVLGTLAGEWRVAPAYDLPSTLPDGDHTMALTIGGRSKGLSRPSLLRFATDLGVPEPAAERVLDDVLSATEGIAAEVAAGVAPFPQQTVRTWTRSLRNRRLAAQ